MIGPLPKSCPECQRPWPDCACRRGQAAPVGGHADAKPEFRGRAQLIGIEADDINIGDILATGTDINVVGTWHCSASDCSLADPDRAVVENHIAHLRRCSRSGKSAVADGEH